MKLKILLITVAMISLVSFTSVQKEEKVIETSVISTKVPTEDKKPLETFVMVDQDQFN